MGLILRDVEVAGAIVDVRVSRGIVDRIGPGLSPPRDDVLVDGKRGALIPGLHDHHLHVLALAAGRRSVAVGPAEMPSTAAFETALRGAATAGAVRAIGYHEDVGGPLDRDALDAIVSDVPVRVQHRTGGLWILNSRALAAIDPERLADARVERDEHDRPTGRVWRGDDLVRTSCELPAVGELGATLARAGVTAVTDATATNNAMTVARLGELPQRLRVMGPLDLEFVETSRLALGEVKVVLDDDALPELDQTVALVRESHARRRGVAMHCVTLVQLRFAIEVFRVAGVAGDRIEHASVAPPDAIADLHALGLTVATQPSFVATRGDEYLRDVDARDIPALYPVASLLAAGVRTLGSSDAPFGPVDPWQAMRSAVDRRTASGAVVVSSERISGWRALDLFGGTAPIRAGAYADLVLLGVPLASAIDRLQSSDVVLTAIGGDVVYDGR
ncbi:MAG: hypothetical protein QOI55_1183 [Actinomycetota bacterium]|nr:hypothetical protein [Actinomycetota bacterium]